MDDKLISRLSERLLSEMRRNRELEEEVKRLSRYCNASIGYYAWCKAQGIECIVTTGEQK